MAAEHDRLSSWFEQELPRQLPAWLAQQRWFGGKARVIHEVAVQDLAWLPAAAQPAAVVVVAIDFGAAGTARERYALVLGVVAGPSSAAIAPGPDGGYVVDRTADADVLLALLAGLLGGPAIAGVKGGSLIYADTTPAARLALAAATAPMVRAVGVEQSNTSVRVGAEHVFKLFRRLEAGEHPQIEMGRFLALAGFHSVPHLEGSLVYRDAADQESALGVLENWVVNEGDGWHHVLTLLDACRTDVAVRADLYADLMALGETTAAFHTALAGTTHLAAFEPQAVGTDDTTLWQHELELQTERTFALLGQRLTTLTPRGIELAEAVIAARPGAEPKFPAVEVAFDRIRIHGDFHLGQTLKTPGGFTILDFEGEPSKPLRARRQKQCALRDVAGMLRSLDYAAAIAAASARAAADPEVDAAVPLAAIRQAFLEGYFSRADRDGANYLPATASDRAGWTSLFELEKALYEVEYELNNRPAWVHIPLGALTRLLEAAP